MKALQAVSVEERLVKNLVFQCMGKTFLCGMPKIPFEIPTKYLAHILKDMHMAEFKFKESSGFRACKCF